MIFLDKMEIYINPLKKFKYKKKEIKINKYYKINKIKKLKKKIYKFFKINKKLFIILGNGSDELINFLINCYKRRKYKYIASFYPTFYMYEFYSIRNNIPFLKIKNSKNYDFNLKNTYKYINKNKIGIFFIANPNNPTGKKINKRKLIKLTKKCKKTMFVIDEAYYFYSKISLIKRIKKKTNNIVILRTFSKIGFAGIRFGILICNKFNYIYLRKKREPYSINIFAIEIISFFLNKKQFKFIKKHIKKIIKERNKIYKKIDKKKLIKSNSNFYLSNFKINKNIKNKFKFKKIFFNKRKLLRFTIYKKYINKLLIKKILNEKKNI
ncbi:MAG: aminotransferase class I/II-fold pyridoxal phosphate-dependent enzyme [Candidatus Vidania fulgoroideorum]